MNEKDKDFPIQKQSDQATGLLPKQPAGLPNELMKQFLDNQARELEIRSQEMSLKVQADKNNFDWANNSLQAKKEDRKDEREHEDKRESKRLFFYGIMALFVVILFCVCLFYQQAELASEIIKAIIYISVGGLGGYGVGRSSKQDKPDKIPHQN